MNRLTENMAKIIYAYITLNKMPKINIFKSKNMEFTEFSL